MNGIEKQIIGRNPDKKPRTKVRASTYYLLLEGVDLWAMYLPIRRPKNTTDPASKIKDILTKAAKTADIVSLKSTRSNGSIF